MKLYDTIRNSLKGRALQIIPPPDKTDIRYMIDHWFEYLPAAQFTPEGRWYIVISVLLLMAIAFVAGYVVGKKRK